MRKTVERLYSACRRDGSRKDRQRCVPEQRPAADGGSAIPAAIITEEERTGRESSLIPTARQTDRIAIFFIRYDVASPGDLSIDPAQGEYRNSHAQLVGASHCFLTSR